MSINLTDLAFGQRQLTLPDGEIVKLRFDDDLVAVFVKNKEVGRLEFSAYQDFTSYGEQTCYHMKYAFIEGEGGRYKHRGIGTEAFRLFRECTGAHVTFSEDDGTRRDDGSHLTGDAPFFVAKLKEMMKRGEI